MGGSSRFPHSKRKCFGRALESHLPEVVFVEFRRVQVGQQLREDGLESVVSSASMNLQRPATALALHRPEMIVREQHATEQILFLQCEEKAPVALAILLRRAVAIEAHPGAEFRRFNLLRARIILRVNPNERPRRNAFLAKNSNLIEGRHSIAGVNPDGKPAMQMNPRSGTDQFRVKLGQLPTPNAELEKARPHVRAVDAIMPVGQPARAELVGGFAERVLREKFISGG